MYPVQHLRTNNDPTYDFQNNSGKDISTSDIDQKWGQACDHTYKEKIK
jgi:hypothetical protein